MKDAFGVDRDTVSKAMNPKQLVTLLRYSSKTAPTGGARSVTSAAVKDRIAQRAATASSAGMPAKSMTDAFKGISGNMRSAKASDAMSRAMAGAAPKPAVAAPKPEIAAPKKMSTRRKVAYAGAGTLAGAGVGGGGYLGYKELSKRDEMSIFHRDPRTTSRVKENARLLRGDKYDRVYDAGMLGGMAAGAIPAWRMSQHGPAGMLAGMGTMTLGGLAGGAATTPIRRKMARTDAAKKRKVSKAQKRDDEYRAGKVLLAYKPKKSEQKAVRRDPAAIGLTAGSLGLAGGGVAALTMKKPKAAIALSGSSFPLSFGSVARQEAVRNKVRRSEGRPERSFWTGEEKKVSKAMSAKAGKIISSYGKMGNSVGRGYRLKAKSGLNIGPGRLTSAVNQTNGQPTKWAKGKPGDLV